MITQVPTNVLMGKAINDNSYLRYVLNSDNAHHNKILEYDAGVFFCFKTKAKNIKLNYTCYYAANRFADSMPKWIGWQCNILGKTYNNWFYLNEEMLNTKILPVTENNMHNISISAKLKNTYEEYQVCFPVRGKIYNIEIDSDEPIEFVYKNNSVIFLGSSISCDFNTSSHMNLSCYLYRKYGINAATLGISQYHTLLNNKLISELDNLKNKTFIMMDLEHVSLDDYKKQEQFARKCKYLVIDSIQFNFAKNIKKYNPDIELINLHCEHLNDGRHLNDFGTAYYAAILKNKHLI